MTQRAIVRGRLALLLLVCAAGCARQGAAAASPSPTRGAPPAWMLGGFEDDYGIHYTITADAWLQHPRATYRAVRWNVEGEYLVARNDSANQYDGGKWTRIDWVRLPGMAPYEWAFCLSAYDAATAEAAEAVTVARRATPRTGCNGHPFSRMKRIPGGA